jgi:hypothetical protein
MASIEGRYRGPLTEADAHTIVEHLRAGRPASELLAEKSYEGDYARRLGERHRAESEGEREEGGARD